MLFRVCVCFGSMCLTFFLLRDDFESLKCCLDLWLYSMLDCIHICVFHISRNCFEKLSRHLLNTLLSVELLKFFFLNTISTPPRYLLDRLTKLLHHRQLLNTCWIDRASVLDSDSLLLVSFLDTSTIEDQILDTYLDRSLDTSRSCICQDLLAAYIRPLCDLEIISLRSLSRYFFVSFPKHSHLTPNLFLKVSSSFFQFLLTW